VPKEVFYLVMKALTTGLSAALFFILIAYTHITESRKIFWTVPTLRIP
jgi:hypothetical protein